MNSPVFQQITSAFGIEHFRSIGGPSNFLGKRTDGVPVMWHTDESGSWDSITVGVGVQQAVVFKPSGRVDWMCAPHPRFNAILAQGLERLGFKDQEVLYILKTSVN